MATAFVIDGPTKPYTSATGGRWYSTPMGTQFNGSLRIVLAKPYIIPVWVGLDQTHFWTTLGVRNRLVGEAGSLIRLGVYELDPDNNMKPKTLLVDAGTIAGDTTGAITKAISLTTTNIEWLGLCMMAENAPTTTTAVDCSNSPAFQYPPIFGYTDNTADFATAAVASMGLAHTGTVTQGALPATGSGELANFVPLVQPNPLMWIRRSTTPSP